MYWNLSTHLPEMHSQAMAVMLKQPESGLLEEGITYSPDPPKIKYDWYTTEADMTAASEELEDTIFIWENWQGSLTICGSGGCIGMEKWEWEELTESWEQENPI